jgi:hypothetical protein
MILIKDKQTHKVLSEHKTVSEAMREMKGKYEYMGVYSAYMQYK